MKKLLEKLKNYKYKWVILFSFMFIILFLIVVISDFKRSLPKTQLSPIIKSGENANSNETTPTRTPGSMYLVQSLPKSGNQSTLDLAEYIQFKFSEPVDISSLRFIAIPEIALKPRVFDRDPYTVWFIPAAGEKWFPRVNYKLTIYEGLISKGGSVLQNDIFYNYYNEPPATVISGE